MLVLQVGAEIQLAPVQIQSFRVACSLLRCSEHDERLGLISNACKHDTIGRNLIHERYDVVLLSLIGHVQKTFHRLGVERMLRCT